MRNPPPVRRLVVILVLATVLYAGRQTGFLIGPRETPPEGAPPTTTTTTSEVGGTEVGEAFAARRSGVMLTAAGRVVALLADDTEGTPHQKFLIEVAPGHTVLVSHNLDLAERIPLAKGDAVEVRGQYEWNEKGGVLHWTHDDPAGRHPEGFVEHAGVRYR